MELLGFIAMVLATISETAGQMWSPGEYQPPAYNTLAASSGAKAFCYYLQREGWLLRYRYYPDGTPCRYWYWPQRIGYCLQGKCTIKAAPVEIPCDGVRRSPGYATSCNYMCTQGFASYNWAYRNGTPCLQIDPNGRRAGPAGLCMSGTCNPIYEPTLQEDQLTHPSQLLQCPDKEHTGRNILTSCYYYCNKNGTWYAGYYDSKPSSGCNLRNPTARQPLGWCCRGDCIKKYNCEP
uniref:Basic tail secreted protein n=1 Tax=Rhipicephalus zambeziensis TaxID=60191 RepID=A0A224YI44_9ACAR